MENKNTQALFQLQDSYVKDFDIHIIKRADKKEALNITGQMGFRIINICEDKKNYIGQIELNNDLKILMQDDEYANIHISMCGVFLGAKTVNYDKDRFEQMLKLNGATTLSHFIRAYIYTVTGLSGMQQISTPMINFVEFFENVEEASKQNELKNNDKK